MHAIKFSICDVGDALHSVYKNQKLLDGAYSRSNKPLVRFVNWLEEIFSARPDSSFNSNFLDLQTNQILGQLINAEKNLDDVYSCTVAFHFKRFSVQQSSPNSSKLIISDLKTKETIVLDIDFLTLKQRSLNHHLQHQRQIGNLAIELSDLNWTGANSFGIDFSGTVITKNNSNMIIEGGGSLIGAQLVSDMFSNYVIDQEFEKVIIKIHSLEQKEKAAIQNMSAAQAKKYIVQRYIKEEINTGNLAVGLKYFDLTGDLSSIDFNGTILSRKNWDAIVAGKGNLTGARLAKGESATGLNLAGIVLDKDMARSLIDNGAAFKTVLSNYLATAPTRISHYAKTKMLQEYIDLEITNTRLTVDLSEFDLKDVDVEKINFRGTLLSQAHFNAIAQKSGNIRGATLVKEVNAAQIDLEEIKIDKPIALQLIAAGANTRSVLIRYLDTERSLNNTCIDIDGIDLTGMDRQRIDFLLTSEKNNAPVHPVISAKTITSFEQDFLALLETYSQTVAGILLKSATLESLKMTQATDPADKLEHFRKGSLYNSFISYIQLECTKLPETIPPDPHEKEISYTNQIEAALKTSTGNCFETAYMSKTMVDLYVNESLAKLGYTNYFICTNVLCTYRPSDHFILEVVCIYAGKRWEYIVDPWNQGKAWKKSDGMKYYRANPNSYTKAGVQFYSFEDNMHWNKKTYLDKASDVFNRYGVNEALNNTMRKNKSRFTAR